MKQVVVVHGFRILYEYIPVSYMKTEHKSLRNL